MNEEIPSRAEITRELIIQAAHTLFLEHGFHGTSMRQIAQQAGIALGGIYNHFASKEDIFRAIFMEHHPYFDVFPAMNSAQGETVEEFVRDAASRMVGALGNRLDFLNLMFIEMVEFRGEHIPALFQIIFPQVLDFAQRFFAGRQELRPIPLPILVRAFVGLFFSYTMTEIIIDKNMPDEFSHNALDYFIDIYLHGIIKAGSGE